MTNESINCLFECYVKSIYYIHKLCRYNHINNIKENFKGFGFEKKLVFNGFKQVLLTHQTTVDKYLEDRPGYPWYGISLHAKDLCYNKKTLIFNFPLSGVTTDLKDYTLYNYPKCNNGIYAKEWCLQKSPISYLKDLNKKPSCSELCSDLLLKKPWKT